MAEDSAYVCADVSSGGFGSYKMDTSDVKRFRARAVSRMFGVKYLG